MNRRGFIGKLSSVTAVAAAVNLEDYTKPTPKSFFIATWNNQEAVKTAQNYYSESLPLLDSIVKGINTVEDNPLDQSVGYGGRPDREGKVTLDACVMDHEGNAGSVVFLQNIKYAISLAHDVLKYTPHVILAGEGARQFALSRGYSETQMLTDLSKKQYETWLKEKEYKPIINIENHDTIGMLGLSDDGRLSGGCSTSGLSYKMHGRVGDSPIIGAGLYVDNEVGACVATGLGEKVLTSLSAFLVVEFIRQGLSPSAACKKALERIIQKEVAKPDFQVGLIAIDKKGGHGGYSIFNGFQYAHADQKNTSLYECDYFYKYE